MDDVQKSGELFEEFVRASVPEARWGEGPSALRLVNGLMIVSADERAHREIARLLAVCR